MTYSGELDAAVTDGVSPLFTPWSPDASFIGGTVTTSPSVVGDDIRLNGTSTGTSTITFGSPVTDPLFAIWSLGNPGFAASFTFDATPTFQAGGPNSDFGGGAITILSNVVSGLEGNGVVQFTGTFSSISFTSTFDHFYVFTGGRNEVTAVPEPAALILIGSGVIAAGARGLRNSRRS